jgi:hypothetical protein
MILSHRKPTLFAICALVAWQYLPAEGRAQQTVPRTTLIVRSFLHAAYPHLRDRSLIIESLGSGPSLRLEVGEATAGNGLRPYDERIVPVLLVNFDFDDQQEIRGFRARGAGVNEAANAALGAALRDGTVPEIGSYLRTAGARFTPADGASLMAAVPLGDLETVLGPLTTTAPVFEVDRGGKDGERHPEFRASWRLNVSRAHPDPDARNLRLIFEPFGGRLIAVEGVR